MVRNLFNLFAGMSLVLGVAVTALWVRGHQPPVEAKPVTAPAAAGKPGTPAVATPAAKSGTMIGMQLPVMPPAGAAPAAPKAAPPASMHASLDNDSADQPTTVTDRSIRVRRLPIVKR